MAAMCRYSGPSEAIYASMSSVFQIAHYRSDLKETDRSSKLNPGSRLNPFDTRLQYFYFEAPV